MSKKSQQSRTHTSIQPNLKTTGCILIAFGCLYWFCFGFAPKSPLYIAIQSICMIAFGTLGTHMLFVLMIRGGVMMVLSKISSHRWMIKGLIIMLCVSAIFNLPFVDTYQTNQISAWGGYASWPILQILLVLMGHNPFAIKTLVIAGTIILFFLMSQDWYKTIRWGSWSISPHHEKITQPSSKKISHPPVSTSNPQSGSTKSNNFWQIIRGLKHIVSSSHRHTNFDSKSISDTHHLTPKSSPKISIPDAQNNTHIYKKQGSLIDTKTLTSLINRIQSKTGSTSSSTADTASISKTSGIGSFAITSKNPHFDLSIPTFPLTLLDTPTTSTSSNDQGQLKHKAKLIQDKLQEFGLVLDYISCDIGPSIIQLRFQPQAGVKLSKIESYKDDIQYALKVKTLRIVAPIPGTDAIGIQIPNPNPRMVKLAELLGSTQFQQEIKKSQTHLSIGLDIENTTILKTLESMPHLLVAGATGSGKSVGINDFILSLIYQNTPTDLKFVMIDPKQVELEMYDGLPYLLAPVITTPDKALKALKRSVDEMESRYTKLKSVKLKHISEYNESYPQDQMSRIVIIIDELADLMLSGNKKEIETYIVRIAQKARAVGMHLITATQRPSVNVITGLIKANIPTRIAFGVAQLVDSRTILDQKGAENLVGKGDLLYLDPSIRHPLRIQAPFVSTAEISRVVGHLKSKIIKKHMTESDFYHPELISILETKGGISSSTNNHSTEDDDESLVQQAIHIITTEKKASTTLLQRKLSIGFARAGRLMDILESRGIVGPQDGAKPRSILI